MAMAIAQHALGDRRIVPLGACQHLLQPIQMLDAGQTWLLGQAQPAQPHAHAMNRRLTHRRRRERGHHAGGSWRCRRRIAALADAARHGNAHHGTRHVRPDPLRFVPELVRVRCGNQQALAAGCQSLHVPCPQRRTRADQADAFEQAVAVSKAAIEHADPLRGHAVDQQPRRHQPGAPSARSRPRALARVSSSSAAASESATMPAPARRLTRSPVKARVRIRMFKSRSPLQSR